MRVLYQEMANIDGSDKEKFDAAFQKYVDNSPVGAEDVMYEKLAALVKKCHGPNTVVEQEAHLNSVETLLDASRRHNDTIQSYLRKFIEGCGAEYHPGPIKEAERIEAKVRA